MKAQVKWDEYETAILIDAFWIIENKIASKTVVIEETSKLLRCRARNLNMEIDDTFRNENGISMQLSSIAHAFFPDRHSLKPSKIFEQVASLYGDDKDAYNALLAEAIKQSESELVMTESEINKQLFAKWLNNHAEKRISTDLAIRTFDMASEYGVMHHAFKKSLWCMTTAKEFTDAISRLLGMRLFRLMHKQTSATLSKIIPVYKSFLSELNENSIDVIQPTQKESIDRTDAIYLIDFFYANKGDTGNSIEEVSQTLRKRATVLQKDIDENYMCIATIENLFDEIRTAIEADIHDTSDSLIFQLVDLRKNNYAQYKLQSEMVAEQFDKLGLFEKPVSKNESDYTDLPTESKVFEETKIVENKPMEAFDDKPNYNDATYLSDAVYKFLKKESAQNMYGTTLSYIASQVKAPDAKVKKILDSAEWADLEYGKYKFVTLSEEVQVYDFDSPKSLVFTKPISIDYFGEAISDASTWRKLYVDFMKVLYEDYPNVISGLAGVIENGTSVPLIIRVEDLHLSKSPGPFAGDLYVEMNRSANDIMRNIKKMLDMCNVDYENIVVKYIRKQENKDVTARKDVPITPIVSQTNHATNISTVSPGINTKEKENEFVADNKILEVIRQHYGYGFNINSPIELIKFRNYFAQDMGCECTWDDTRLATEIRKCGFEFGGKIYVIEQETQNRIISQIKSFADQGTCIIYYEDYYLANEDWLYDGKILSSEMMKALLEKTTDGYQFRGNFFLTTSEKMTELEALKKELIRIWGNQILRSFNELKELLPFVPMDKIKYAMSYGEQFTWNSFETYSRNDYFTISDEQIEQLIIVATEKCAENGNTSFDELPLEDIVAENYELSEYALFDTIFKFLSDKFDRNNRVIVMKGDKVDTTSAIVKYCSGKESCTMSELETVMQEVSGELRYPVVIEAAHLAMTRVGADSFVSDDHVLFDVQAVDSALDSIVKGNGIGMLEVTTFGVFPFCGYSWNHFVLESFCRKYSEKYKYVCITPNSKNAGAIVKKSCCLAYHDLMAEAVARSDVEIEEKAVYDFLVSTGYMIKRQYNNMNDLLEKANLLRKGAK